MLVSHMKIVVTISGLIEAQKIQIVYHHMFHLMARKCGISFSLSWRTNPKGCIHWSSSRLIVLMTLSCARRSHLHPKDKHRKISHYPKTSCGPVSHREVWYHVLHLGSHAQQLCSFEDCQHLFISASSLVMVFDGYANTRTRDRSKGGIWAKPHL